LLIQEVAYGYFDQGLKEAKWVAAHGWAESVILDDLEDANLLKTFATFRQYEVGSIARLIG
jgi:hypothetical protein